jgi:predicted negative regulator of RcsB-dependent stress response
VITLQLYAIELETELGRHDAALARLTRIAAGANRQETWLVRRGEILESAGRTNEAQVAYAAALDAIEALPTSRRSSRAMQELKEQARTASEKLNRDAAGQGP